MNDPTARALQLLSLLQTHKFWSGVELAEQLQVSARTLRRDVARLRELGYAVEATPGADGGYRLAAGAHMPPLLLDDEEAVAIAVGLRSAATASVSGIEDTSLRAMAKLEQALPHRLRRQVDAVYSNVMPLRWRAADGPTVDAGTLAVLAQGCRDNEQVRFDYERWDGEATRRLVEPHQLVAAGRRWYLVAWDVRRDAWRTFRVDRLSAPQLAGARFRPRQLPAADASQFVAQSLSAMPMPYQATVVAQGPVEEVRDMLRWADAEVEPVDAHSCRVHLRATSIESLLIAVAMLAVAFDIAIEMELAPSGEGETVTRIDQLSRRLALAAATAQPG